MKNGISYTYSKVAPAGNESPAGSSVYLVPSYKRRKAVSVSEYYTSGSARARVLEQHISSFNVTSIKVKYTVADGHTLVCTIVIS
jgi:hypothetical protein